MKQGKSPEEQIVKILKEADAGIKTDLCRPHSSLGDLTPAESKLQEMSKIGQNL